MSNISARGRTGEADMVKSAGAAAPSVWDVTHSLQPIPRAVPVVREDRRPALRQLRTLQRDLGNHAGAELTNDELLHEEIRHVSATPSAIPWDGRGGTTTETPLTAA
jgi:hypothetical protein